MSDAAKHGVRSGRLSWLGAGWVLLLAAAAALSGGCEPEPMQTVEGRLRIVTLAPALTQMVVELGLGDDLVGVAEHDMAAPPGLPVVGNFTDIDAERIIVLRPTHVLMTAGKEGVPTRLRQLAEAGRFELLTYPHPDSIADVARTLYDRDNADSLGPALGEAMRASRLRQDMLASLEALRALTADRPRPRVLIVLGANPLMASGPGTVHDELLEYAGGVNAAADATVTAPAYDREALLALNPQVILILSPGASDAVRPLDRLPELAALPIDAVRDDRLAVLNDPLTMLPSTSLPRIAAKMAAAIHPDLADAIDALRGIGPPQAPPEPDAPPDAADNAAQSR